MGNLARFRPDAGGAMRIAKYHFYNSTDFELVNPPGSTA